MIKKNLNIDDFCLTEAIFSNNLPKFDINQAKRNSVEHPFNFITKKVEHIKTYQNNAKIKIISQIDDITNFSIPNLKPDDTIEKEILTSSFDKMTDTHDVDAETILIENKNVYNEEMNKYNHANKVDNNHIISVKVRDGFDIIVHVNHNEHVNHNTGENKDDDIHESDDTYDDATFVENNMNDVVHIADDTGTDEDDVVPLKASKDKITASIYVPFDKYNNVELKNKVLKYKCTFDAPQHIDEKNMLNDLLYFENNKTGTEDYLHKKELMMGKEYIVKYDSENKIKYGTIPKMAKTLIFNNSYNHKINKDILPKQIKKIVFGTKFNKTIHKDGLPDNLEILIFGCNFNQDLIISSSSKSDALKNMCVIPTKLKEIEFGYMFNRVIEDDSLPNSLEKIVFGKQFNKKIKIFPNSLKYLKFGSDYQHEFKKGELPESLTVLILGNYYNQKIQPGALPKSLKYLNCGNNYDQAFQKNALPNGLTHLKLGDIYDQEFKFGVLPASIESLSIGGAFNQKICKDILPKNIKKLKLGDCYDHKFTNVLPDTIEVLKLGRAYSHKIDVNDWPSSLTKLILCGSKRNLAIIDNLPNIDDIVFNDLSVDIVNLPYTINTITLFDKTSVKYLKKIPFDCKVLYKISE